MRALIEQWADDLFVHGHDLARWITDYVDFEESLAVGSMAQEDLAHAAELLAATGHDARLRDARVFERPSHEWAISTLVAAPAPDWPTTVARGYLFSQAVVVLAPAVADGVDAAKVIEAEQALHVRHWQRWVRLMNGNERTRPKIGDALARQAALTADLFADPSTGTPDAVDLEDLHARWRRHIGESLGDASLKLPARAPRRDARAERHAIDERLRQVRAIRLARPDWNYAVYD